MHILLTDILSCPRCGPSFGLILLAEELNDRQVLRGHLGCPNCRQSYGIEEGVVDLRSGAGDRAVATGELAPDPERAYRIAALMGVTTANANLLILDQSGELPAAIGAILPQAHIIGGSVDAGPRVGSEGFVSRVMVDGQLPFRTASMRGVALAGIFSAAVAREARRVLMPAARLVVESGGEAAADELRSAGFHIELEQDRVVVAAAPGHV